MSKHNRITEKKRSRAGLKGILDTRLQQPQRYGTMTLLLSDHRAADQLFNGVTPSLVPIGSLHDRSAALKIILLCVFPVVAV